MLYKLPEQIFGQDLQLILQIMVLELAGWTTTAGNGSSGTSGATNNTSINAVASQPCGGSISLYCVEQ